MIADLKARIDALSKTNPWLAIRLLWAEVERLRQENTELKEKVNGR